MDLTTDVIYGDGQENMGGIKKIAYIGLVSAFSSIAKPVASPMSYADTVTIATAHVLAAGKKVIKCYVMYDKSGIASPSQGGRKMKSSKPKVTLVYPGNDAAIIGLVNILKNSDCLIFVQPEDDSAPFIQIGTEDLPATLTTFNVNTGTAPDGDKGVTLEFEAPSRAPYYIYTAALPLAGASS